MLQVVVRHLLQQLQLLLRLRVLLLPPAEELLEIQLPSHTSKSNLSRAVAQADTARVAPHLSLIETKETESKGRGISVTASGSDHAEKKGRAPPPIRPCRSWPWPWRTPSRSAPCPSPASRSAPSHRQHQPPPQHQREQGGALSCVERADTGPELARQIWVAMSRQARCHS